MWISQTRAPMRAAASTCVRSGVDEDAGHDAGRRRASRPAPSTRFSCADDVEAALGGDLLAALGHQHRHLGPDAAGDADHLVGGRHLEVELDVGELAQPPHVLVLDVAAVLAQVHGDAVGAAQVRLDRGPHRVGLVGAPRLADGGDVVDVDAQLDHRSPVPSRRCRSRTRLRVASSCAVERVVDEEAHELLGLRDGGGIVEARRARGRWSVRPRNLTAFAWRAPALRPRATGAALDHVEVLALGDDRRVRARLARELERVAQLLQQRAARSGAAPARRRPRRAWRAARESGAQLADGVVVGREQALVRIVAVRELEQQLVQVEGGQQALRPPAAVAGAAGSARLRVFSSPRPNQSSDERLERHQQAARRRLRPARALGHEAEAAVRLGPHLQDQAGLAVRVACAGRSPGPGHVVLTDRPTHSRAGAASPRCRPSRSSPAPRARGSTLPPKSASIAWRASVPMRLSVAPFSPITIALWPSRSTKMVAAMRRRLPSSSNCSIDHRDRVRQLVAQQAEDALAHELGGEEALGAVGDLVGLVDRRRLRAGACGSRRSSGLQLRALLGAHRHERGEVARAFAASASACGELAPCRATRSTLFSARITGTLLRQQLQHRRRRARPSAQASITSTTTSTSAATWPTVRFMLAVQRVRVLRLVAGRVDEDELRARVGEDARGCGGAWSAPCAR